MESTATGSRPDRDHYFLDMVRLVASRATCIRRSVGCVLVDEHGHVLATGYNGVPRGEPHCIETPCAGASQPSGQGLHLCEAIHAEENALLQCSDVNKIFACYTTSSPCLTCMRKLRNTGVKRIVFSEVYPHVESRNLAARGEIEWVHIPYRTHRTDVESLPGIPSGGERSS